MKRKNWFHFLEETSPSTPASYNICERASIVYYSMYVTHINKKEILYSRRFGIVLGTGFVTYAFLRKDGTVHMARRAIDYDGFMAAPVTPVEDLKKNANDMKSKMELMILRIQAEFCRALEAEEDRV